jgi:hypothetical protein
MPQQTATAKEPTMAADETARAYLHQLDSHDDRIRRLEDLSLQFGPAVARIDEKLGAITSDVGEMKVGLAQVSVAVGEVKVASTDAATRVAALESAAKEKKERRIAVVKWVGGIVAAIVTTALLAFFGLK